MISRHMEMDLDAVAAGMVLSQDVLDSNGGVLLPQGTILTDALLRSLQRRGVDTVRVVNNAISEAQLQAERERVQQWLDRRFRTARGGRAAEVLRAAIMRHRLEGLQ